MSITKRSEEYTDEMINRDCGDTKLGHGMHEGWKIKDVPISYLEWAAPIFRHDQKGIDINKYLYHLKSENL